MKTRTLQNRLYRSAFARRRGAALAATRRRRAAHASRGDHRHVEHHRAAAPADRHGRVGHRLRRHRAARLCRLGRRAAHADRHRRQQLAAGPASHVGAHSRRGQLPHAADDRRRQSAGSERAASRAELRQPAHDERPAARRGAARAAGLHLRRGCRRRRQRHHEARRRRARRPARHRVRRLLDCARSTPLFRAAATGAITSCPSSISRPTVSTRGPPTRCCATTTAPTTRRCMPSSAGTSPTTCACSSSRATSMREAALRPLLAPCHVCDGARLQRARPSSRSTSCRPSTRRARSRIRSDSATIDIVRDDFTAGRAAFGSEGRDQAVRVHGQLQGVRTRRRSSTASTFKTRSSSTTTARSSRDQKGYYVEYQGAFDDAFFLSLGARYDDNDDFGSHTSSALEPRVCAGSRLRALDQVPRQRRHGLPRAEPVRARVQRGPVRVPAGGGPRADGGEQRRLRRRHRVRRRQRAALRGYVFRSGDRRRNFLRSRQLLRLPAVDGHQHVEGHRGRGQRAARRALGAARQLDEQRRRRTRRISRACSARRTSATWAFCTARPTSGSLHRRTTESRGTRSTSAVSRSTITRCSIFRVTYDASGKLRVLRARAERDGRDAIRKSSDTTRPSGRSTAVCDCASEAASSRALRVR